MMDRNRVVFTVALFVVAFFPCLCHAEKEYFLDDDPRFPRVYAFTRYEDYLDLESCNVVSGDSDGFEISADVISQYRKFRDSRKKITYRFRKNEESAGKLQCRSERDQDWWTFPDPYDEEAIARAVEETRRGDHRTYNVRVDYRFRTYYLFKCVYRQLFGESYEDNMDDEVLRHSVIIPNFPPDKEVPAFYDYLWDDRNYPCVWRTQWHVWYLDKSSIHVETETPSQSILHALVLEISIPPHHDDDVLPNAVLFYRFRYDKDEGKMYLWSHSTGEWDDRSPDAKNHDRQGVVGEAAFYIAYGERFYDMRPRWDHNLNIRDDYRFYERLDGEDHEQ